MCVAAFRQLQISLTLTCTVHLYICKSGHCTLSAGSSVMGAASQSSSASLTPSGWRRDTPTVMTTSKSPTPGTSVHLNTCRPVHCTPEHCTPALYSTVQSVHLFCTVSTHILHSQYICSVQSVHLFCTVSTPALYSQYTWTLHNNAPGLGRVGSCAGRMCLGT